MLKTWTRHGPIKTSNDPLGGAKQLLSAMVGKVNPTNIYIILFILNGRNNFQKCPLRKINNVKAV